MIARCTSLIQVTLLKVGDLTGAKAEESDKEVILLMS